MENQVQNSNGSVTVNNVVDDNDKPIVIPAQTARQNRALQEVVNATGYNVDINVLTAISARVIPQKFYTLDIARYLPIRAGNPGNAWATSILRYRSYSVGGDFNQGIINDATGYARLAETDARIDSFNNKVVTWAKQNTWSLPELAFAQQAANWDLVEAKERSRAQNFALGIQQLAFIGDPGAGLRGFLNMVGVNSNTTLLTKPIKSMNDTEFRTFVAGLIPAYRANNNYNTMPTAFIIPESDYTGLAIPNDATFSVISRLDYLTQALRTATMNPNFQILPNVYGQATANAGYTGLGLNRYALVNMDEDTYSMDVPVPYTTTAQNSINGFQFQNVGYARFSGAVAGRSGEIMYFDY